MSADHTIHSFRFDLTQLSQQNHSKVEDRVVRVFNQSFYTILNRVANRFAIEEELILDQLVLDLGGIPQEELDQQLPLRFERAIQDYFTALEKKGLNQPKVKEEVKQHPLVYYLFNGVYPWYSPQQEPFKSAWVKSLERKSFVQQLFQYTWSKQAIKRLVQIGFLAVLEKTLKALVPDQEGFILNYHDELLEQHENKTLAQEESKRSFHFLLWEFTLQYILNAKGSRFSKKQFVMVQFRQLSAHYNILHHELLQLIFSGFRQLKTQSHHQKELYSILQELNEDFEQAAEEQKEETDVQILDLNQVERLLSLGKLSAKIERQIRNWLLQPHHLEQIKKGWLNPLKEGVLYALVEVLVGVEARTIIQDYHEMLWELKATIAEEPTTNAYKQAVWRFTLDFLAQTFSSYFQAKAFVKYHSQKIAQHFNFNQQLFLEALVFAVKELAVDKGGVGTLMAILVTIHQEEYEVQEENNVQQQFISQRLNQLLKAYETSFFHSDQESYFFLEKWAIRLIEEIKSDHKFPISFLLEIFSQSNELSKSFIKVLQHHQQFELEYIKGEHSQKDQVDFLELIRSFSNKEQQELLLINGKQEFMLRQWMLGKKAMDTVLLIKLLNHEKQLSHSIVEEIRKSLRKKSIQQKLLQTWVTRLNANQFKSLLSLMFSQGSYLSELFQVVQHVFIGGQQVFSRSSFLTYALGLKDVSSRKDIWKSYLSSVSQEFGIERIVLEQKFLQSIVHQVSAKTHLLTLYFELIDSKQYFGEASSKWMKKATKEFNLTNFLKLEKEGSVAFSNEEQKKWNNHLFRELLNHPDAWVIPYFSNNQLHQAFQSNWKWLSEELKQLYLVREKQWKRLELLLSVSAIKGGKESRLIQFVFQFEDRRFLSRINFKTWKEQELQYLQDYLKKKTHLEQWVRMKQTVKIDFLKQSKLIGNGFFFQYYQRLEAVYKAIPAQHKPYSYLEFELSFWKFLSTIWDQKLLVWQIFEKWVTFMSRSLRLNAAKYGDLETLVPPSQQKQWSSLKEKLAQTFESEEKMNQEEEEILEEEKETEMALDKWELNHTGLVILHPFFKQLMSSLKLLNEKQAFTNSLARSKAICMLLYLATGEQYGEGEIEEYELAFPKLLCGASVSSVVANDIRFTPEELSMADDLLNACLQHWKQLGNTSRDGLRNTFLKRMGRVEEKDSAYQLFVEKSGTDILLDTLPWSISMIRLPWLEQPMYVSWR